jgi:DNA helicase-2/ATP-dependent DNA helicase PcrA
MNWDEGLINPWKSVAASNQSPLRVIAGPGTGKTFALMRRVARLLQSGSDPRLIFLCTFTRTAAADLARALNELDVEGTDQIRAGTVHGFCFRLLTRNEVLQATGRVPRPLFDFEQRFLLEDLSGSLFGGIRDCQQRLEAFNGAWARLQSEDPGWPKAKVDQQFQHALLAWLKFHEAMLIGELVPEALRYLRNNPVLDDLRFEHVLVDEYQDLNRAEQVLLQFVAHSASLSIVGDEDQCIYQFKYANPEGIREFLANEDHELDECQRCPKAVVAAANELISHNPSREPRTLQCKPSAAEGEIHVVQWQSMREEAEGIAKFIAHRVRTGSVHPGRVLVLTARRQFGYAIRDALTNLDVGAQSFFQEEILDGNPKQKGEHAAQQAITLLTLFVNDADRVALRCWCGFGSPTLRKGAWARLREYCEKNGDAPLSALARLASGQVKIAHTNELIERYRELIALLDKLRSLSLSDAFGELFPESADWAASLRTLALPHIENSPDAEPSELLDLLRTAITQPELPTDVDYVRVMSLHKSKGLTADLVVVAGCIEGAIPRVDSDAPLSVQELALQEQRRLFYVAITRTTATLVLSSIASVPVTQAYRMGIQIGRRSYDRAYTVTSRFIDEVAAFRGHAITGAVFLSDQGVP